MRAGDGASRRRSGMMVCSNRACAEETGGGRGFRGRNGRGGRSGGAEGGRERDLGVSGSSKAERRKAHAVEEYRARMSGGPRRNQEMVV
jgi:hypothetical protein